MGAVRAWGDACLPWFHQRFDQCPGIGAPLRPQLFARLLLRNEFCFDLRLAVDALHL